MDRTVVEADGRLEDLIARAEAGEEVVITRPGKPAVQLLTAPVAEPPTPDEARAAFIARLEAISRVAGAKATPGPDAARPYPTHPAATEAERFARIAAIAEAASREASFGPDAARSQDFLYDDHGLPA